MFWNLPSQSPQCRGDPACFGLVVDPARSSVRVSAPSRRVLVLLDSNVMAGVGNALFFNLVNDTRVSVDGWDSPTLGPKIWPPTLGAKARRPCGRPR